MVIVVDISELFLRAQNMKCGSAQAEIEDNQATIRLQDDYGIRLAILEIDIDKMYNCLAKLRKAQWQG